MPLWGKDENFKAKLQQKMCLAKETPEPVFDLADCNLSEVPPGVYSMCRVFLKEVLILSNNRLSSLRNGGNLKDLYLLRVLDLSSNKISSLPDDIQSLINLEVFNLENNLLKKLPSTFLHIKRLRTLNLKRNKLSQFPVILCDIENLQNLDISCNPKLQSLPKELCRLPCLSELIVDSANITYPPSEICDEGTESILKFLCKENGIEFIPPQKPTLVENTLSSGKTETDAALWATTDLSEKYELYQRAKDKKQQELLQMEELLRESDFLQAQCVLDASKRKQQFLEDFAMEQDKLEREILQLQSKKDEEKQKLLIVLTNIDEHSELLMAQLNIMNEKRYEDQLERLEQDRLEFEDMISIKQKQLEETEKNTILNFMNAMRQAEEEKRQLGAKNLKDVCCSNSESDENEAHLQNILDEKALDQQNLINNLLQEEEHQKEAFEALLLQKDKRHLELTYQINLIEEELSKLTLAEVNKQDLKANIEINILAERRVAFALLLSDLLEAKRIREMELKERLEEMEEKRLDEMKDFWLLQFEKLMDKMPPQIAHAESNMDQMVRTILVEAGATLFIPLFAVKYITLPQLFAMSHLDLKKLGILDDSICEAILSKCTEYLHYNQKLLNESTNDESVLPIPQVSDDSSEIPIQPSAPEEELENPSEENPLPSAPPSQDMKLWCQTECVICLDEQSKMVFIPCGHVCCCESCSNDLLTCPMCRQEVSTKCILNFV